MTEEILTEEDIDFSKVRDYVTFLIYTIGGEKGLSKKAIHKACFAIKEEVGDKIEINNELPFYWYYFGPFSNVINDGIEIAINDDLILPKDEEDHTRFFLKDLDSYRPPGYLKTDLIKSLILKLNIKWFGTEDLTEFIYKNYAPRKFRYNFYKTWKLLNQCADRIPNISFRQEHFYKVYQNQILEWLYTSEGTLPKDDLFKDYINLFSYYVMSMQRFFNPKNKFNSELIEHLDCLKEISEHVWKTFGEGERILEHDNYIRYKESLPYWNKKYCSQLISLKKSLKELDENMVTLIGKENLKRSYTQKEKEFLSTVLSEGKNG